MMKRRKDEEKKEREKKIEMKTRNTID